MKFKVKDLVEMLTMQKQGEFARKYGLTTGHVQAIKSALKRGEWRLG